MSTTQPTNHLDAESISWLEQFLDQFKGTVVCITHDRYFLENVAKWILELDRGQGIPFEGNYSQWLDAKNKRLEGEKKSNTAAAKAVAAELEWVRSNPKAKGVKSKARLRRYDELLLAAAPTEMRTEGQIYIPPGPRLGDVVIDVHCVRKAFGDRLLFDGLEFNLPKAGIVGVIGPNGAGNVYLCFSFVVIMHALTHWISHSYVRKIYFDQNANGKRHTRWRHNNRRRHSFLGGCWAGANGRTQPNKDCARGNLWRYG